MCSGGGRGGEKVIDQSLVIPRNWQKREPHPNMGGPRSRTRTESIKSTLLGKVKGKVRLPRLRVVGIDFAHVDDPVSAVYAALLRFGYRSPEELRAVLELPPGPCLVAPSSRVSKHSLLSLSDGELLSEALILGLCTKAVYNPERPIIWTKASLTRRLDMFETGGFYALD